MHLFIDYIHPLTVWLHTHSSWALFITFFISFCESLAIIGTIIPGSVTMTAIGILAGSGVMRIDLTFLAATLGAIAGDSGSYALGYLFSDRLAGMWPFKNYPHWILYGKAFFSKWGSTSVLIGRFFGPMRSIIPVIAGMMHMRQWQFLLANTLSAVGWSILYVCPGILIGAASTELSTKSTTRLFTLMLLTLVIIWMIGLVVKWLMKHTPPFLRLQLHACWLWMKRQPRFAYLINLLTPRTESDHYPTAGLSLLLLLCFFMLIVTIALVYQESAITNMNTQMYLFFQSIRTPLLDVPLIVTHLIISPLPLYSLTLCLFISAIFIRDWRTLSYCLSLALLGYIVPFLLAQTITIPTPHNLITNFTPPSFPDIPLTFATSIIGFLLLYMGTQGNTIGMFIGRMTLLSLLCLAGIAIIYLGDNWVTSVIASYLLGCTIFLAHWMGYRRYKYPRTPSKESLLCSLLIFSFVSVISCSLFFQKVVYEHAIQYTQYIISEDAWWNQPSSARQSYSTNRFGHQRSPLNIQYLGSIRHLQAALEKTGWKRQPDSFFYSLLMRVEGEHPKEKFSLMAEELYQNKKPTIIMTYRPNNQQPPLILRFWRSNYSLHNQQQPIWIGSLNHLLASDDNKQPVLTPYTLMLQGSKNFKFNKILLPNGYLTPFPHSHASVLLMIKEINNRK